VGEILMIATKKRNVYSRLPRRVPTRRSPIACSRTARRQATRLRTSLALERCFALYLGRTAGHMPVQVQAYAPIDLATDAGNATSAKPRAALE
jgi:hypothetical protein